MANSRWRSSSIIITTFLVIILITTTIPVTDGQYLHHFWFQDPGNRYVNQAFTVHITAKDDSGNTYYDYNDYETVQDYSKSVNVQVHFLNGEANVEIKITKPWSQDKLFIVGKSGESYPFNVMESNPSPLSLTNILIIVGIAAAIAILIIIYRLLKRPKKAPKPAQLRVTAEPVELVADGQTRSVITIQLLDKNGKPITALDDTQIQVSATKGKIENPTVIVPKGKFIEQTAIVSSLETGVVPVTAEAKGLQGVTITLNFLDKKRYCMHCGTMMSIKEKACKNCGKTPPAGADVKTCQNCQAIIPEVAKFCSECGAGQQRA
jgi:RNA polymerase subunit RPABC4/transcription elongation factor Spt4